VSGRVAEVLNGRGDFIGVQGPSFFEAARADTIVAAARWLQRAAHYWAFAATTAGEVMPLVLGKLSISHAISRGRHVEPNVAVGGPKNLQGHCGVATVMRSISPALMVGRR
jgi:hypothetical protein